MKRLTAAILAALALGTPLLAQPAQATHTLCDNEPSDINDGLGLGIGIDANSGNGVYLCVGKVLVYLGSSPGRITVCTDWPNRICPIVQ